MANVVQVLVGWGALFVSAAAIAHGGGLSAEGCHNNRKTGDYHCHQAPMNRFDKSLEAHNRR